MTQITNLNTQTFNVAMLPGLEHSGLEHFELQQNRWDPHHKPENIPDLDPNYQFFDKELAEVFYGWSNISTGDGFYFWGPTGAGKSSFVRQWCANMGIQLEEANGHDRMLLNDFIGQFVVVKDGMVYVYGPLARAIKFGHWFLINEMDQLDPSVLVGLNTILDGCPVTITENGGEIIKPHPDFRFIATGNTAGTGDTGDYAGVSRQNMAFMDRFWVMEVDYPPEKVELEILQKIVPELPEVIAIKLISIANQVRGIFTGKHASDEIPNGMIDITFSTRTLIRWAINIVAFSVRGTTKTEKLRMYKRSLGVSLLNRANPESREAVYALFDTEFGHDADDMAT